MSELGRIINLLAWVVCVVGILFNIYSKDYSQAGMFFVLLVCSVNSASAVEIGVAK